jgi:hypothetical protein
LIISSDPLTQFLCCFHPNLCFGHQ